MNRISRIRRVVAASSVILTRVSVQSADHLTVMTYLRRLGVHPQWIKRWGSAFGRKATAAYRAENDGSTPRQVIEHGREVAVYATARYLDAAMSHYRTHKVAGPHLEAGYDRTYAAKKQKRDARGRFLRVLTVVWSTPDNGRRYRRLPASDVAKFVGELTSNRRVVVLAVRDIRGRAYALAA